MLYEITLFKVMGSKRQRMTAMEVQASDHIIALERSHITLKPNRVIEIRVRDIIEAAIQRPPVNRIRRDAA